MARGDRSELAASEYEAVVRVLRRASIQALFPIGRSGSMLLHALIDDHPQVLTMPGALFFSKFWESVRCLDDPVGLAREFVWFKLVNLDHLRFFDSRYDRDFGMDCLGPNGDLAFRVDQDAFEVHFRGLAAAAGPLSPRDAFVLLHGAYGLARGLDVRSVKAVMFHPHDYRNHQALSACLGDLEFLVTVRDPYASLAADMLSRRDFKPGSYTPTQSWSHLDALVRGLASLGTACVTRVVRLEDLNRERARTMRSLADDLGVEFRDSMMEPSFNGLLWEGDRLTQAKKASASAQEAAWSPWFWYDRPLIRAAMGRHLSWTYGERYPEAPALIRAMWRVLGVPLSFLPTKFELNMLWRQMRAQEAMSAGSWAVSVAFVLRRMILYVSTLVRDPSAEIAGGLRLILPDSRTE